MHHTCIKRKTEMELTRHWLREVPFSAPWRRAAWYKCNDNSEKNPSSRDKSITTEEAGCTET